MESIIIKWMRMIEKLDVERDVQWYWDNESYLRVEVAPGFPLFNLRSKEVEDYATPSCGPDLWILRALGVRMGCPVRLVDWVYYNN